MLDMKSIRKDPAFFIEKLATRGIEKQTIDDLIALDEKRRGLIGEVEELKAKRNQVTDEIAVAKRAKENADDAIADMKEIGEKIKVIDSSLPEIENQLNDKLAHLPNVPHESVPVGVDDSFNVEQRTWQPEDYQGRPVVHENAPSWLKPHFEIGEELGILDFERGAKVSGARNLYYVGAGARLERAIYNFMLDEHQKEGYVEMQTPTIVNDTAMFGTGQYPKFQDDAYRIQDEEQTLIPTAEVALTNYYAQEVLPSEELPIGVTAVSSSYRREAGAAGRDTRGLIRLHEFKKVEMVQFTRAEQSYEVLEQMTSQAENILQKLGLPYHVVALSTGDMGFSAAKTYDLEVWLPAQQMYREISSVSNTENFQARRMHIQYRDENGKLQLAHTLNGSGLAVGRTTAAILENYQNEDGSITIPDALVKYFGSEKITKNTK